MYKLPHKFSSIEEKVLIDSEADFQACVELFKNPDEFPPELYIWNYEDESPKKLPNAKKDRDCDSVVSRDSNQSKICKEKDGYICLCCGFFGPEDMAMKCCHLYEIKAHHGGGAKGQVEVTEASGYQRVAKFGHHVREMPPSL